MKRSLGGTLALVVLVAVAGTLLTTSLAAVAGAPATPTAADAGGTPIASVAQQVPRDAVFVEVTVLPEGDAVFRMQFRFRLADENDTAAFQRIREDIETNETQYTGPFAERMTDAQRSSEQATGREMAVENVTARAYRTSTTDRGVVEFRFRWAKFAAASGGQLRAGPAWVGPLPANWSLRIRWPEGYRAAEVSPDPTGQDDRSVRWAGAREFGTDQPMVVLEPTRSRTILPVSMPVVAAAVGIAALLVVGVGWRRYGGRGAAPSAEPESESPPEPPDELLSDAERVLQLVEDNGGRMKQQEVVEILEWSETKTSQVVRELREDGQLEVFRIGRENVLALPGEIDV